jgi:hypothetical protein
MGTPAARRRLVVMAIKRPIKRDVRDSGLRKIRMTTAGIAIAAVAGSVAVAGAAYESTTAKSGTAGSTATSSDDSGTSDRSGNSDNSGGLVGSTDQAPQAQSGGS